MKLLKFRLYSLNLLKQFFPFLNYITIQLGKIFQNFEPRITASSLNPLLWLGVKDDCSILLHPLLASIRGHRSNPTRVTISVRGTIRLAQSRKPSSIINSGRFLTIQDLVRVVPITYSWSHSRGAGKAQVCGYREVKSVEESFRPFHNVAGNIMSSRDCACVKIYVWYFQWEYFGSSIL